MALRESLESNSESDTLTEEPPLESHNEKWQADAKAKSAIHISTWGRRTLGLACLLLTVFLWTVANFLASYIFADGNVDSNSYNKPFFVVFIDNSMFAISLIPISIKYVIKSGGFGVAKKAALQAWREKPDSHELQRVGSNEMFEDETAERLLGNDEAAIGLPEKAQGSDKLTLRETVWLSVQFCMIWFFGNYFASACLQYTSVGSTTILTSTSSVWTLILGALLNVEAFSCRKLMGVVASLSGIVLISCVDMSGPDNDASRGKFPHKSQQQIAIGDAMALFSAMVYGLYVVFLKFKVGSEDRVNMPMFFGLVGVCNLVLLWPIFFFLHYTGIETFELPSSGKVWMVILANSISSFVSDISWTYAMLLTTPLLVTVGLSLTIPLSLIGEMVEYEQYSSLLYWVGAAVVVLSFLFVNEESTDGRGDKQQPAEPAEPQPEMQQVVRDA